MDIIYKILFVAYVLLIVFMVIRIILDTETTPKALGYLLLVLMLPAVGIVLYFALGINFRHLSSRYRMAKAQEELDQDIKKHTSHPAGALPRLDKTGLENFGSLIEFLKMLSEEPLRESYFALLIKGKKSFRRYCVSSLRQSISFTWNIMRGKMTSGEMKLVSF
jgi:cardiolipin synthase